MGERVLTGPGTSASVKDFIETELDPTGELGYKMAVDYRFQEFAMGNPIRSEQVLGLVPDQDCES